MTQQKRRRQMLALVQRWQASTDTQATFAQRHGLSRSALQYWLRQATAGGTSTLGTFAPVRVTGPSPVDGAAVEIVLVGGERVVVPPHASADHLRVVLSVLRPSC